MAYKFNEKFFDKIDSEEKAYWLGFLAADAGINIPGIGRDAGWVLCVNLQKRDKHHLEKFLKALDRDAPLYEEDTCVRLQVGSKHLVESLINLGITPRKSHSLKPWVGPKNLQKHYWRGMFDGDGSVGKFFRTKGLISYPVWTMSLNGNFDIVSAFRDFISENGIKKLGYFAPHYSIHKVKWGGIQSVVLPAKTIYSDYTVCLQRKEKLFLELFEYYEKRTSHQR